MQTEIFIAGAGLAGLSLAASLHKRGIDYWLAEARDRIGGRILSAEFGDDDNPGGVADLGPSWIWPGQAHIAALLNELELGVFDQYSSGRLVYEDELGQVRRDLDYSSMGGSLRVDGGITHVTDALAATLPGEAIHLSHRVCAIRENKNGYLVDLVHPGGTLQVAASKVVLAIPPRLIASLIEFEPSLPDTIIQEMNSVPTWMAGHAKLFAFYEEPFWRAQGLSGDGISRRGPLMEIHDASAANPGRGALFGFVGLAAGSALREPSRLVADAVRQFENMYGADAANPLDVTFMDWAVEEFTATEADQVITEHPPYGLPPGMATLADKGLLFASTEMAPQFGGFIEGALEASRDALARL
ncbi:MAG: NAD(P)-binding protein [Gammaproteobacteria bacterium]|nr:NAD(P)-binding protein [Gammaproteobacteria bacterium]